LDKSGIFKCISLLNGLFRVDDDQSFLKEGVKSEDLSNGADFASQLGNFFSVFTSIVFVIKTKESNK
jgi:hypothetical protein